MGWTSGAPSTMTWAGGTPATETFSAAAVSQIAWGQPKTQPGSDDPYGQDFEYQFSASAPMIFSEDRPLFFASSLSEGNP